MSTRELVFSDSSSHKFWKIELDGDSHTVTYGRVGTTGQTKTKEFADDAAAKKAYDTLVEQKLKKGYVDAGGSTSKSAPAKKATKKAVAKKTPAKKTPANTAAKKATKKKVATKKTPAAKTTAAGNTSADSFQLVFADAKSSKFWNIVLDGSAHTVHYGRLGAQGQQKTKEFPSAAAARTSFDKLVAEKRKKGYNDSASGTAASGTAASGTAAPLTATAKKTAAKGGKAKVPAEPVGPTIEVDLKVTRLIDLAPEDWCMASYRPREKTERSKPPASDIDAAVERLGQLKPVRYGWALPWEKLSLQPMAREEAHFWFNAMTEVHGRLGNKEAVVTFANKVRRLRKSDGKLTTQEATKRVKSRGSEIPDELMIALYSLFTAEQCLEIALTSLAKSKVEVLSDFILSLHLGLRKYVFPHVTQKELAAIQKRVRKTFDSAADPEEEESFPIEHYLAAGLGMHKEVYSATSGWDDNRFTDSDLWLDQYQRPQEILMGLGSSEAVAAEWRRLRLKVNSGNEARGFLACTEFDALDVLVESVLAAHNKERCSELLNVLALVRAPEAAEPMLECRLSAKVPSIARDWMSKNVGNAVAGLIETAGKRGKLGDAAIDYLRGVKREGHVAVIEKCVKKAGKKSVGAARVQKDVLEREEKVYTAMDAKSTPKWLKQAFDAVDIAKPPQIPAWAAPATLSQLTVGNHCLNEEQLGVVLQVLAVTPLTEHHPLLDGLKQHASKQSRDAFVWQLFQLWLEDGANVKIKWAMASIGHLGDDDCVLKLTPLVRAWPGESQHPRAVLGLECLRRIGSDIALMQLSGIAQKLKFKGLKARAATCVEEIAKEKGMTRAELEDRVIPDCGLDEMGRREISFGPRSFSFVLGGDLKPMVKDDKGKVRPNPPQPGANDDQTIAKASLEEWKLIKKQIKEVAVIQSGRLEQAMVTGRRWTPSDFELLLVRHPLMTHLAQKLIWGTFNKSGERLSLFRVTEERDYADANDDPTSLGKADSIGLLHPLDLSDVEKAKWGEVLSDYEIISPFPQLGREVYSLEKGEQKKNELERFHGMKLYAPTLVFNLEKMGWIRGEAMDAGCFDEHSKQFPAANVTAVVGYDGTVGMGYIDPDEMLTTDAIHFCQGMRKPSGYRDGSKKKMKLGDVAPIVISEVLADLQVLKSKSK